jgi:1-deoxy-D-xylulose-5-phosphate reductoisomerase
MNNTRRVAVLGSSGSIGRNALEVIAGSEGRLEAVLLSVNRRTDILAEQIRQMAVRSVASQIHNESEDAAGNKSGVKVGGKVNLPRWVVITDETADRAPLADIPPSIEVLYGYKALSELVRRSEVDVVLSAIVGSAGLTSTWNALEAGKTVALANKESLVMGGSLMTELAKQNGGRLIPVDSEHSAVMQVLQSWRMRQLSHLAPDAPSVNPDTNEDLNQAVEKIILTASGGPFRTWSLADLAKVTVEKALAHPTWEMGRKITIDSATLMNKALEIIEARWFFDIPVSKIDVVIHPQSIVHSMVEFIDGSTIAQLSPPDMRLPIQLALNYPNRYEGPALPIDWKKNTTLEFYPPDFERFPALALGLEVAQVAGTAGSVVNAANETAVEAFLNGKLEFQKITEVNRSILEHHQYEQHPTLEKILEIDAWARKETEKWIGL